MDIMDRGTVGNITARVGKYVIKSIFQCARNEDLLRKDFDDAAIGGHLV
jgi:hypothetical protein